MILCGVLIIIDDKAKAEIQCRTCHQPLGDKAFGIAVQPSPPNSVTVEFYEHVECAEKAEKEFQEWKKAQGE